MTRIALATTRYNKKTDIPNLITISGYGASLWWLLGGSPWLAVYSLVADEVDGRIARKLNEESEFGGLLDWGTDISFTALLCQKLGILPALPLITGMQVYLRSNDYRPAIGSTRALLTIALLYQSSFKPLKNCESK